MNLQFIKKRVSLFLIAGCTLLLGNQALAADTVTTVDSTVKFHQMSLTDKVIGIGKLLEQDANAPLQNIAFLQLDQEDDYKYIREKADAKSKWVGKMFSNDAALIIESGDTWSKIQSGDVTGYIQNKYLLVGKIASLKAEAMLKEKFTGMNLNLLDEKILFCSFSQAVSREEIEAQKAAKRQSVVDFAEQFIGNPYVWGGTSLTRGADCSGFVKSVYANFGVSLPHSSYGMRRVGTEVSVNDIQPGDIVCYAGHVGIYAGNGQIVNAIDDDHGIGMSSLRYTKIVTVRRIFN